ncbi:hypothetical protein [Agromyces silvae]|uniref:hypothetical protein n=1 Tax=Agromyces silvae TaxID=3388266 RepID=UPI00280B90ED|nr:hypothetical protein [Agromyces protaetiae]
MAEATSDTMTTRDGTDRRPSALAAVVITLLILGFGFVVFGYTPAVVATMYLGIFASYVAIPYTAIALVAREVSARRTRPHREGDPAHSDDAIRFGLFRQRASLVNAIAMLTFLIVVIALSVPWGAERPSATGLSGSLMTLGTFAFVAGTLAIVVNVPSIYSRRVVGSERHAIRERVGAWKLILATTILTTASWLAYCGFALYFLTISMSPWS